MAGRGAALALGPREDHALARARHRHVQQPPHRPRDRAVVGGQALLEQLVRHAVGRRRRAAGHARRRQPEHEHVVELAALRGLDRHHLRRPRRGAGPASSSGSPESATAFR